MVRTHPVTGWKTLYVNENFTKEIVGLEKRVGDGILDHLFRTVAEGYEFQVRWKWSPNAVAIWDNRATFHTGIFDYCECARARRFPAIQLTWSSPTSAPRPARGSPGRTTVLGSPVDDPAGGGREVMRGCRAWIRGVLAGTKSSMVSGG